MCVTVWVTAVVIDVLSSPHPGEVAGEYRPQRGIFRADTGPLWRPTHLPDCRSGTRPSWCTGTAAHPERVSPAKTRMVGPLPGRTGRPGPSTTASHAGQRGTSVRPPTPPRVLPRERELAPASRSARSCRRCRQSTTTELGSAPVPGCVRTGSWKSSVTYDSDRQIASGRYPTRRTSSATAEAEPLWCTGKRRAVHASCAIPCRSRPLDALRAGGDGSS